MEVKESRLALGPRPDGQEAVPKKHNHDFRSNERFVEPHILRFAEALLNSYKIKNPACYCRVFL
ncbi:MAG: hypothetical protein A2V89_04005 [Gammaproteobacteria bacterium RBG_16_37_9]|nr:MAG: hypothetical protein A2V89_04005 [Gammaproteobacteria bacterium RBG_16_37_9]